MKYVVSFGMGLILSFTVNLISGKLSLLTILVPAFFYGVVVSALFAGISFRIKQILISVLISFVIIAMPAAASMWLESKAINMPAAVFVWLLIVGIIYQNLTSRCQKKNSKVA